MPKKKIEKKQLKTLTSPIKVGYLELKNRMWLAPMNDTLSGHNGEMTEQCLSYYAARAKGGRSPHSASTDRWTVQPSRASCCSA